MSCHATLRLLAPSLLAAFVIALLTACATPISPTPAPSQIAAAAAPPAAATDLAYRCDRGGGFNVHFADNAAMLTGPRGRHELLRDAGGLTPAQTVYSSAQLRVEFGLGVQSREAVLHERQPQAVAHCVEN